MNTGTVARAEDCAFPKVIAKVIEDTRKATPHEFKNMHDTNCRNVFTHDLSTFRRGLVIHLNRDFFEFTGYHYYCISRLVVRMPILASGIVMKSWCCQDLIA